jgi:hypothetical protein
MAKTLKTPDDPDYNWAANASTSQFILMHEPPAIPYWGNQFYHWHDGQKFISAVGFVDGHADKCDFTEKVTTVYPLEPTAQWIWYKEK